MSDLGAGRTCITSPSRRVSKPSSQTMIPNGFITVPSRRVLLIENSPSDRQTMRSWLNGEMIETYADLDHFKRVNDVHGHAAGDEVLRRIAMILRGSVLEGDFLARYGGEEFVVLSPNCDVASALQTAERIRSAVEEHKVTFRNTLIPM